MQSDAWYFLDVFLRKAIDGHLSFTDFFVKRAGADHAQPLFKLVLLFEWHFFDLDFKVEALIGLAAAVGCGIVLHRLTWGGLAATGSSPFVRPIAWMGMCLLLFTLNADASVWTWSLVSLEYVALLTVLLYFVVAWHAIQNRRGIMLWLASLAVCISCDDLGTIATVAVALTSVLVFVRNGGWRNRYLYKLLALLALALLLSRIFYNFMPVVGTTKAGPLWSYSQLLPKRFAEEGWWQWIVLPMTFPVFHESWLTPAQTHAWAVFRVVFAIPLVLAHVVFWRRAWRCEIKCAAFAAICLMLLFYGQLAGIIIGRVAAHGNEYLEQSRYMIRYAEMPIALLLMWAESARSALRKGRLLPHIVLPAIGCLILLAVQIPLSMHAWGLRPFLLAYQVNMANQIGELSLDPGRSVKCLPELPFCKYPPERRRDLTGLLRTHQLNVFSPRLQQRYPYLPKLTSEKQTANKRSEPVASQLIHSAAPG